MAKLRNRKARQTGSIRPARALPRARRSSACDQLPRAYCAGGVAGAPGAGVPGAGIAFVSAGGGVAGSVVAAGGGLAAGAAETGVLLQAGGKRGAAATERG